MIPVCVGGELKGWKATIKQQRVANTGHKQVIKGDKGDEKIKKIKDTVIKIYRSAKAEQK